MLGYLRKEITCEAWKNMLKEINKSRAKNVYVHFYIGTGVYIRILYSNMERKILATLCAYLCQDFLRTKKKELRYATKILL